MTPATPTTSSPVPPGSTARRLEWRFLPPNLRAYVERKCGSPVVHAESQGAGFTPGFASVLTCEDGSRHFVKAASTKAQKLFAASYREEARKLTALPGSVPAPRLLWHLDDDWVVLGLEYVEARNPSRPWAVTDLDACLDALELVATELTPAPEGLALDDFAADLADWPAFWDHVRESRPELPHVEEAAALAARLTEAVAGDTVVHTDTRDDNFLLDASGTAWICDWNWPTRGAAWIDSLMTLIGPRGDGLDVEAVIAARPLLRDVPPEHIDILLALVTGYFLTQGDQPTLPSSPYLRQHQAWQGQVCWAWLCERRGWV